MSIWPPNKSHTTFFSSQNDTMFHEETIVRSPECYLFDSSVPHDDTEPSLLNSLIATQHLFVFSIYTSIKLTLYFTSPNMFYSRRIVFNFGISWSFFVSYATFPVFEILHCFIITFRVNY